MEHRTHDEIARVARLYGPNSLAEPLSREARLRRWISLLETEPQRILQTLRETEFQPRAARDAMRADNSVITVAYEDPVLRAEGLRGDTYGDAKEFFALSDRQMHHLVCYCHGGPAMSGQTAAWRVMEFLPRSTDRGIVRRIMSALFGRT